jgi:hypothetical protein
MENGPQVLDRETFETFLYDLASRTGMFNRGLCFNTIEQYRIRLATAFKQLQKPIDEEIVKSAKAVRLFLLAFKENTVANYLVVYKRGADR